MPKNKWTLMQVESDSKQKDFGLAYHKMCYVDFNRRNQT